MFNVFKYRTQKQYCLTIEMHLLNYKHIVLWTNNKSILCITYIWNIFQNLLDFNFICYYPICFGS